MLVGRGLTLQKLLTKLERMRPQKIKNFPLALSFLLLYVCIKMNTDEKYNRLCLELLLSNSNKITRLNPNEKDKYLKY